jgi:hypothetical protein
LKSNWMTWTGSTCRCSILTASTDLNLKGTSDVRAAAHLLGSCNTVHTHALTLLATRSCQHKQHTHLLDVSTQHVPPSVYIRHQKLLNTLNLHTMPGVLGIFQHVQHNPHLVCMLHPTWSPFLLNSVSYGNWHIQYRPTALISNIFQHSK